MRSGLILNISEAANLAIHALAFLAKRQDPSPVATAQVAGSLGVSEAHLSKVFQRLTRAGLVRSLRGPRGGFLLAKEAGEINLLEIYEAIDGRLRRDDTCMLSARECSLETCVFGNLLKDVHDQVEDHFEKTTLEALLEDAPG